MFSESRKDNGNDLRRFAQIALTLSDSNCIIAEKYAQEDKIMERKYTAIVRKSKLEYVAVCLELNVTARGDDLADVEKNLRMTIELYQEDMKKHPEIVSSPISTEEFIEFLRDTEPEWHKDTGTGFILKKSKKPWLCKLENRKGF